MKTRVFASIAVLMCMAGTAPAEEAGTTVPRTYNGAGESFKEGGKELGEGFKSLGRGLKRTFTGEEAKEEYKGTKNIGEGFKDVGLGIAGGARATGEKVKEAVDE